VITKRLPRRLRHGEEATLVEHLGELRSRLVISLLTLAPAFIVAFIYQERLVEWLTRPLPDDKEIVTLGVVEPFTTAVKVSLAAAVAVTLPILLYQLWAFLAPAIEERVQRTVAVFAVLATILFAGGVAFSYFVVMPRALEFLTNFNEDVFEIQIRASYYFSFITLTLLATGLAFQMPMFILALVRLRVLTAEKLRRNRRFGILFMVVFAVLLPTVDPVSLALEVVPLLILFEISIWLATFMEKRWGFDEHTPGHYSFD
jgi:sec-independent protein translocase protein TatC